MINKKRVDSLVAILEALPGEELELVAECLGAKDSKALGELIEVRMQITKNYEEG